MGNILTTVISYNETEVYVFKDTNEVITTMCRIKFLEVDSTPSSVATDWVYSSTPSVLNPSKYDVTIEYRPDGILSDYILPVYDPTNVEHSLENNTLSLVTFTPVAFIFNSDKVIVTPNKNNETFTVTIVDTNTIFIDTTAFDDAIFRVTTTETEIYGYVRDQYNDDVAITRNESITAISKNFVNEERVVIQSIALTKGRWLVEATGSFDCFALTQVHFWFDIGGLLNELTLVPQYRDSLRTFNSQSNSNMSITMQSEFFFEDSTLIYWCTTPDTAITSSIFSNTIPTPSIANPFIDHAISPSIVSEPSPPAGTNNAKITAISISGV
tara:strand:+ start:1708 stop:2688 length:981 start_codon:yes stop_codon:yes gene_type:complete